jgi:hypothetical protein
MAGRGHDWVGETSTRTFSWRPSSSGEDADAAISWWGTWTFNSTGDVLVDEAPAPARCWSRQRCKRCGLIRVHETFMYEYLGQGFARGFVRIRYFRERRLVQGAATWCSVRGVLGRSCLD